jgi:hypothetical protein
MKIQTSKKINKIYDQLLNVRFPEDIDGSVFSTDHYNSPRKLISDLCFIIEKARQNKTEIYYAGDPNHWLLHGLFVGTEASIIKQLKEQLETTKIDDEAQEIEYSKSDVKYFTACLKEAEAALAKKQPSKKTPNKKASKKEKKPVK